MQRRDVLKLGVTTAATCAVDGWTDRIAAAFPKPAPIIDCHIHMFDTARPGGVPWPEKGDAIYRPALPDRYARIARPLGVVGAIAVEASPLVPVAESAERLGRKRNHLGNLRCTGILG